MLPSTSLKPSSNEKPVQLLLLLQASAYVTFRSRDRYGRERSVLNFGRKNKTICAQECPLRSCPPDRSDGLLCGLEAHTFFDYIYCGVKTPKVIRTSSAFG
ncbi:transcriptional regulator, MarR family [Anopheles sinensis]|uniref:Transcriptional regulator, MarR family n=1 Tax=Anopheles sinensis TaxID=74873 RepID=A0A084VU27_ANOSI|nr:transcriptional regulator, MarR family [Anopheles sinensis]